jgi:hypothetical protein
MNGCFCRLNRPRTSKEFRTKEAFGRGVPKQKERVLVEAVPTRECTRRQASQAPTPLPRENGVPRGHELGRAWRWPGKRNCKKRYIVLIDAT